ncbi:MAG: hypothetical protein A2174_03740 [Candidatus Portnoybacteria bacterium RBG_13_41_18]|uniref:Adenylate kinase n=1 Tax=Candidatus Portnoybacteria bacterium RBG_13_41_18 TaxID=1801991 RepID=A0A1G2F8D9_9BACT|nr:MAG: hypothetical protein A2174_03740 [Candidatus Portnoybacteria bacterium RBG_13_41_18]
MQPLIVIILGRSGCGKGTQAEMIQKKFDLDYFGSGDALRKREGICDFTGKKIEKVINSGIFVPVPVIVQIWINKLEDYKNKNSDFKGLIFDGAPRKLMEAELMDLALEWYEWDKNVKVLLIDISEEEAFNRLTKRKICKGCGKKIPYLGEYKNLVKCDECGGNLITRADDTKESIRGRLNEFNKETLPVIEHYKNKGWLIKINGEQGIEKVHESILTALEPY